MTCAYCVNSCWLRVLIFSYLLLFSKVGCYIAHFALGADWIMHSSLDIICVQIYLEEYFLSLNYITNVQHFQCLNFYSKLRDM